MHSIHRLNDIYLNKFSQFTYIFKTQTIYFEHYISQRYVILCQILQYISLVNLCIEWLVYLPQSFIHASMHIQTIFILSYRIRIDPGATHLGCLLENGHIIPTLHCMLGRTQASHTRTNHSDMHFIQLMEKTANYTIVSV